LTDKGWIDVSCDVRLRCLCQHGHNASEALLFVEEPKMKHAYKNGAKRKYDQCFAKREVCWWFKNTNIQEIFIVLALPCVAILTYTVLKSWCVILGLVRWTNPQRPPAVESPDLSLAYGQLLDFSESAQKTDVIVNRWVIRGAWGAILHAAALLALAVTTIAHTNYGIRFGFGLDALEALAMFICKVLVGLSICTVHWHLSPQSRMVTASWVAVLAISKVFVAACALILR